MERTHTPNRNHSQKHNPSVTRTRLFNINHLQKSTVLHQKTGNWNKRTAIPNDPGLDIAATLQNKTVHMLGHVNENLQYFGSYPSALNFILDVTGQIRITIYSHHQTTMGVQFYKFIVHLFIQMQIIKFC